MTPDRARALELSEGLEATPKNIDRLSLAVGVEAARWAFTQWELRDRAKTKFTRADRMLFDREGLEMASAEELSDGVHTLGFPKGARVADLTAGIGGDLIGLSKNLDAVGLEIDQERAEIARHNLGVCERTASVRVEDCLASDWDFDYAFADPARRAGGRRTLDPSQFSPRLDLLFAKMQKIKFGRIKLSPMLNDEFLDSLSPDRVFVSHQGECKEVLVHTGRKARDDKGLCGCWSFNAGDSEWLAGEVPLTEILDEPQEFVFEADPAVIRSHGLGNYGIAGLGESNGYLTANEECFGLRKAYRALWHGPYRMKDIRYAALDAGVRVAVVKTRGVDVDVQVVRRETDSGTGKPGVLLLYPVGRSVCAVLCE